MPSAIHRNAKDYRLDPPDDPPEAQCLDCENEYAQHRLDDDGRCEDCTLRACRWCEVPVAFRSSVVVLSDRVCAPCAAADRLEQEAA